MFRAELLSWLTINAVSQHLLVLKYYQVLSWKRCGWKLSIPPRHDVHGYGHGRFWPIVSSHDDLLTSSRAWVGFKLIYFISIHSKRPLTNANRNCSRTYHLIHRFARRKIIILTLSKSCPVLAFDLEAKRLAWLTHLTFPLASLDIMHIFV